MKKDSIDFRNLLLAEKGFLFSHINWPRRFRKSYQNSKRDFRNRSGLVLLGHKKSASNRMKISEIGCR